MSKRSQLEIITELAELCKELGWVIALPEQEEMVPGLIIGNQDFVEEVTETLYGPGFSIFSSDEEGNITEGPPNKKSTIH